MRELLSLHVMLLLIVGCQLEFKQNSEDEVYKPNSVADISFVARTMKSKTSYEEVEGNLVLGKDGVSITNDIPITLGREKNEIRFEILDPNLIIFKNVERVYIDKEFKKSSIDHISFTSDKEGFVSISIFGLSELIQNDELKLELRTALESKSFLITFRRPPVLETKLITDDGMVSILSDKERIKIKEEEYLSLKYISVLNRSDESLILDIQTFKKDLYYKRTIKKQFVGAKSCSSSIKNKDYTREGNFYLIPISKGFTKSLSKLSLFDDESFTQLVLKPSETLFLGIYVDTKVPMDFLKNTEKAIFTKELEVPVSCTEFCEGGHKYERVKTQKVLASDIFGKTEVNLQNSIKYKFQNENEGQSLIRSSFNSNILWSRGPNIKIRAPYKHPKKYLKEKWSCSPPGPGGSQCPGVGYSDWCL